jgi:branched-chain amino acid transport system permease protein
MKYTQNFRELAVSNLQKPKIQWTMLVFVVLGFLVLPFLTSGYVVRFTTTLFMFVAMSQAWNIIGGFGGYASLGHVAFFGIGAYTTGLLMINGMSFFVAAPIGGLLAAGIGGLIGVPILRLRGHYFAVATFALAEVIRQLANNLTGLTRGGMGLTLPLLQGSPEFANRFFYFAMALMMVIAIGVTVFVSRRSLGYALKAIREDEDAAEMMGINARNYKVGALVLSSLLVGLVGSVYGYWITFLEPLSLFDVQISIELVVIAMLGGAGTVAGPIIGTVLLQILSETVWIWFLDLHLFFLGLILILVVIFIPNGVVDLLSRTKLSRASFLENVRRYRV